MNVCGACGLDFSSVTAFDRHRVGVHAFTSTEGLKLVPPREDGRRCLTRFELADAGFVKSGHGRWTLASRRADALRRFPADPATPEAA